MADETVGELWFGWRRALLIAAAAGIVFTAIEVCPADTQLLVYLFVVAPLLLIATVVYLIGTAFRKHRRRSLRYLLAVLIIWCVAGGFFAYEIAHPIAIRSAARWLAGSRAFKAQVLAQPAAANGELKHIAWDGWGMFAQDTEVFLAFDPLDSLAAVARSGQPGKFGGIPCEVRQVRRLERQWYLVIAFTNKNAWTGCD